MALIDELKQQRLEIAEQLERAVKDVQYFDGRMADLLLAISALEPTPADLFAAEQETAREQLEREPEEEAQSASADADFERGVTHGEAGVCVQGNPSTSYAEGWSLGDHNRIMAALEAERAAPDPDEQDDTSEFISDLTGDPAIEPEAGLHGESVSEDVIEATATKLFNEHWGRTEAADGSLWPLSRQHPGIQEAWSEKARELLAAPTPAVMEMANEIIDEAPALNPDMQDDRERPVQTEPDGYAPVTAEAKMFSHGIQSEQKPERKFDPFAMFKREDA